MTRQELLAYAHRKRCDFMGCPIDALTMPETVEIVGLAIRNRIRLQHVVVNVAKLVSMQRDPGLASDVTTSDLINIDGMGVVWGARLLGRHVGERVAGIDLMESVLARAEVEGWRTYFLGAKPDVLDRAVQNIRQRHPRLQIAGFSHGYFAPGEEPGVAEAIEKARPDCLFVAISSPKKEQFMHRWRDKVDVPFIMGVGGSIDVAAGIVRRAPPWMQSNGLEWAHRLAQEPRRMWRRYLFTNLTYARLLTAEVLRRAVLRDRGRPDDGSGRRSARLPRRS